MYVQYCLEVACLQLIFTKFPCSMKKLLKHILACTITKALME